jgi:LCP family protein required for cell wall assembly
MVERPDCETEDGETIAGSSRAQWNAAYAYGGAACTISQFEHDTDIAVDYAVVVNMGGFKGMVDAVGGVKVCIPETFYDSYTRTTFEEGTHNYQGKMALNYVRVRHGIGDGSDLSRARRQQAFIASMINKFLSKGTLANPLKVFKFLDSATKSLTLAEVRSTGLSNIQDMAGLALQFKKIGMDKIEFITIPVGSAPERGRVQWTPDADRVWEKLRNDKPLGDVLTADSITVSNLTTKKTDPSQEASPSPSESPSDSASSSEPGSGTDSPKPVTEPSAGLTDEQKAEREFRGLCT